MISASRRPQTLPRSMGVEIIKLYVSLLSQFFTLSDVAIAESAIRKDGAAPPIPPFVPEGTNALVACHFGEKLVEEIVETVSDLMHVELGNEAGASLKGMVESLRWRMMEVIAAAWARGELRVSCPMKLNVVPPRRLEGSVRARGLAACQIAQRAKQVSDPGGGFPGPGRHVHEKGRISTGRERRSACQLQEAHKGQLCRHSLFHL